LKIVNRVVRAFCGGALTLKYGRSSVAAGERDDAAVVIARCRRAGGDGAEHCKRQQCSSHGVVAGLAAACRLLTSTSK
jgi:hypothetical protein